MIFMVSQFEFHYFVQLNFIQLKIKAMGTCLVGCDGSRFYIKNYFSTLQTPSTTKGQASTVCFCVKLGLVTSCSFFKGKRFTIYVNMDKKGGNLGGYFSKLRFLNKLKAE